MDVNRCLGLLLFCLLALAGTAFGQEKPHPFNVLIQRPAAITAAYWNPILTYVGRVSGVPLELKLARTAQEGNAIAESGGYDFLYTNHFFTPERDSLGFHVIARPAGPGVQSAVVVGNDSPIRSLKDLDGKAVGFVSPDGFTGYFVPFDALLRAKLNIVPVFTGHQEASLAQLRVGKLAAVAVNSSVLENYARREGLSYRSLWTSVVYPDLCIMAHRRVPGERIAAVRAALIGMDRDPEGRKVLEAAAGVLKSTGPLGFVGADDRDYDGYRTFFRNSLVKTR